MTRRYTGGFISATEQATDANTSNGIYTLQEAGQATAAGNFPTGRWTPQRSLRFRRSASTYLNRTSGTPTLGTKATFSFWIKKADLTLGSGESYRSIFYTGTPNSNGLRIAFARYDGYDNHEFVITQDNGGSASYLTLKTTQVFRDPAAWYHFLIRYDSTDPTANSRVRIFVNGTEITSFGTRTNPPLNHIPVWQISGNNLKIGRGRDDVDEYYDMYLSEVNFIDGQALEPNSFGLTDPETGSWVPKRYAGTYGANGYYLDFRDPSAATAGAIGADRSGNGNNFTPNNISVTAGVTYDSMVDVPGIASVSNQVDIGGVQRGNYATLNPLFPGGYTLSEGNLYASGSSAITVATMGIPPGSGKFYWEATQVNTTSQLNNIPVIGMTRIDSRKIAHDTAGLAGSRNLYWYTDSVYRFETWVENGVTVGQRTASFNGCAAGDVIMFCYDSNTGKWWYGKNGSWADGLGGTTGSPSIGYGPVFTIPTDSTMTPFLDHAGTDSYFRFNFGQRAFAYAPPTGFKSICSTNLPNPVIKRPEQHFGVRTWVGNGSNITLGVNAKKSPAYPIQRSLRFNASVSSHLTRTPASASNRRTWTYSAWIKRSVLGTRQSIFSAGTTNSTSQPGGGAYFTSSTNKIEYIMGGGTSCVVTTDRPFTDTTSWMHLVIAMDTTQVVPSQRIRMYVDGVQITSFSSTTYPNQNFESDVNNSIIHAIGSRTDDGTMPNTVANYYLAEVNFIDGSVKLPSDFGAYDANNNWVPQRYTGTYGTNGFYLPMNAPSLGSQTYGVSFGGTSSSYLTTPANTNFAPTGNFTIGFSFYLNSHAGGYSVLGGTWTTGTSDEWLVQVQNNGSLRFLTTANTSFSVAGLVQTGKWYYFSATRSGSTITASLNGVPFSTTTFAGTFGNASKVVYIGMQQGNNWPIDGYISNFRLVDGTAITSVPTSTSTAVTGTKLLTCNSATIVDNSTNNYTITLGSAVGLPRLLYPFAVSPAYSTLFGASSYVQATSGTPFQFGTGDFTIEMWVRHTNSGVQTTYYGDTSGSSNGIYFYRTGTNTLSVYTTGQIVDSTAIVQPYVWNHVAVSRSGTTLRIFINGQVVGTVTDSMNLSQTECFLGNDTLPSGQFTGSMSNVRVVKGVAVYTGTFTPPTAPLTATQSAGTNISAITGTQTSLLTFQNDGIIDNSTFAHALTISGSNVQVINNSIPPTNSGIGKDNSGNNNHWGTNNIDQTSGLLAYDVVYDVPTDYVDSLSNINANYAVLNSGEKGSVVTVSNGGLGWAQSTTTAQSIRATLPMPTGKWYWELNAASNNSPGILKQSGSISNYVGYDTKGYSYFVDGTLYNNNSNVSFGATHNSSNIISVAFDADAGKLWFAKDGTWQASGDPAAGANAIMVPLDPNDLYYPAMSTSVTGAVVGTVNFGQTPFTYTPPTGFKALNSKNLKDVGSFNLPDSFGNFASTPDLAWMKSRTNGGYRHQWLDTVRGPRNVLFSSDNTEQQTFESVQSFIPNGVTLGPENGTNELGGSHAGWFWNRGKTPGFDIVTYGGDGVNTRMIPHNLGQVPAFYITKCLTTYNNAQSFADWSVYHKDCPTYTGNSRQGKQPLWLHRDLAPANGVGGFFNIPTSSEFGPNQINYDNSAGQSYVAYLWAQVPGFSQFGSYVGNGSTNGPFVYTGFKPAFILTKNITTAGYWWEMVDNKRAPFNPSNKTLYANVTDTEYTSSGYDKDLLSNGFKMRGTSAGHNSSGDTFVYAAFAENPFKYGNAR